MLAVSCGRRFEHTDETWLFVDMGQLGILFANTGKHLGNDLEEWETNPSIVVGSVTNLKPVEVEAPGLDETCKDGLNTTSLIS